MLQMRTLRELKDRRLNTTLVPPSYPAIKHLGSHLTVIMIQQGVEITVDESGLPNPSKQCLLWKDHDFKLCVAGSTNPPEEDLAPPSPKVSSVPLANGSVPTQVPKVDQWIKQSASGILENAFSPPAITKENRSSTHEAIVQPPVERPAPPPRKRHAKSRKPAGVSADAQAPVQVPIPVKDDSTESTTASPHEVPRIEAPPMEPPHMEPPPIEPHPIEPPPIEPPFMPIEANTPTQSEYGGSDPSWEKQVVNTGRAGQLVDDSLPRFNVKDRIQSTDEIQSREFRHTMNQRKSASGAGNSKGDFVALLKEFELATISILELAQNAQGPIHVRMEIGRIMINHLSGSSEYKKKLFSVGDWSQVFPTKKGSSKLDSRFTNM